MLPIDILHPQRIGQHLDTPYRILYFLVVGIYFFFFGSNPYLSRPPSEDALFAFVPADGYDKLIFLIYFMAVYKCLADVLVMAHIRPYCA